MEKTIYEKRENRIKRVIYVLTAIAVPVFLYFSVLKSIFGGTVFDRGMYFLGALITGLSVALVVKKTDFTALWQLIVKSLKDGELKRISCFSLIMLMTLYYYNSSSEYGHTVGLRIIVLLAAIITNSYLLKGEKPDGYAIPVYVFGLLWMAFGLFAKPFMAKAGALNYDAISFIALNGKGLLGGTEGFFWKLMYFLPAPIDGKAIVPYILWGLMVMEVLRALLGALCRVKKEGYVLSKYGYVVMAFLVSISVFSNKRLWVLSLLGAFLPLYLSGTGADKILKELALGVLTSFWVMAFFALLFRPYYSFEFVRYPGWFSSVASAALYRMLVCVTALVCVLSGTSQKDKSPVCGELLFYIITLGAGLTTLILGMARTAILATATAFFTVLIITCMTRDRLYIKVLFKNILLVILSFCLMLPAVYTGIRCIPALIKRPVWVSGPEWFSDRIMTGESPSSTKYMNVPQLAESLLDKFLGIDINLSDMAGIESGPGDGITYDEDGNIIALDDNVVYTYEGEDGAIYSVKDYSFTNDEENYGANGRPEILRIYLKGLNITGHSSMLPDEENVPDGTVIYHAHNTYMQVAHDNGIITGLMFLFLCIFGIISAGRYYKENKDKLKIAIYPMAVIICFTIAGLTEWIFHPSIPIGFAFMTVLAPMLEKQKM